MFFGFPVSRVKQVIQLIQDNHVFQDNHDNHDNHDNQVRLAHLWVDFRVIYFRTEGLVNDETHRYTYAIFFFGTNK